MNPIPDISKHDLFDKTTWKDDWRGAIVGLPLKIGKKVVGVLNVAYQAPREFHENTLRALGLLADQAALAIENAKLHTLVKEQAMTDPLTGLANRRAFELRLEEEIRRSNRYDHPFSIILMDLDGFKRINDTYGHPVGDQTLIVLGESIRQTVRDTDMLVRMGGDEFLLLLPETKTEDAEKIGEKVAEMVKDYPYSWREKKEHNLELTLSFGIACYPEHAKTGADLILIADTVLYKNKKGHSR
jgi:diguanylate cyclase (GGDEF)-like protein